MSLEPEDRKKHPRRWNMSDGGHVYKSATTVENATVTFYPLEERITDPVTGGEKGRKECEPAYIDPQALEALGRVAGKGTRKYDKYNYLRGYDWSLSANALQRHFLAFWGGEDVDPESGELHMTHAAWHALALVSFITRQLGNDDRPGVNDGTTS